MSQEKIFESNNFTDEQLVAATTETVGLNPSQRSLWAQAELTRRLMESIRGFDKATSRYSKVMLALTVALFVLASMQFVATITPPLKTWWQSLTVLLLVFGAIIYFLKKTIKVIEKW